MLNIIFSKKICNVKTRLVQKDYKSWLPKGTKNDLQFTNGYHWLKPFGFFDCQFHRSRPEITSGNTESLPNNYNLDKFDYMAYKKNRGQLKHSMGK